MYLARIILSKWGAGRDVISGLSFIDTLGKQRWDEKEMMLTALATWSGGSKTTVGVGGWGRGTQHNTTPPQPLPC